MYVFSDIGCTATIHANPLTRPSPPLGPSGGEGGSHRFKRSSAPRGRGLGEGASGTMLEMLLTLNRYGPSAQAITYWAFSRGPDSTAIELRPCVINRRAFSPSPLRSGGEGRGEEAPSGPLETNPSPPALSPLRCAGRGRRPPSPSATCLNSMAVGPGPPRGEKLPQ